MVRGTGCALGGISPAPLPCLLPGARIRSSGTARRCASHRRRCGTPWRGGMGLAAQATKRPAAHRPPAHAARRHADARPGVSDDVHVWRMTEWNTLPRPATPPGGSQPGNVLSSPNGVRTRVSTLRGWCPRPLDDGTLSEPPLRRTVPACTRSSRRDLSTTPPRGALCALGGEGSNLQPHEPESSRAASCATPEWANRQFSRPGRPRGRPRSGARPTAPMAGRHPVLAGVPARRPHYDRPAMGAERVVIVGGGVLGTMHALRGLPPGLGGGPPRGRRRAPPGLGAQFRPGVGERPGRRARARTWPCGPASCGSRSPSTPPASDSGPTARSPWPATTAELALMAEAAAQPDAAEPRASSCSTPTGVRAVNPAVRGDIVGGLLLPARRRRRARARSWVRSGSLSRPPGATAGSPAARPSTSSRRRAAPPWPSTSWAAATTGSLAILCIGDRLSGLGGRIGAALAGRPAPPVPAPDDADRPGRRAAHHRPGRRRLDAVLPRLRPPRPGRRCPSPRPRDLRVGHAAAAGPAGRRRPHHRGHPRLRRAVRLRRRGAPLRRPARPGRGHPGLGRCPRSSVAGPACTPGSPTTASTTADASTPGSWW